MFISLKGVTYNTDHIVTIHKSVESPNSIILKMFNQANIIIQFDSEAHRDAVHDTICELLKVVDLSVKPAEIEVVKKEFDN